MKDRRFNEDLAIGIVLIVSAILGGANYLQTYLDGFLISSIVSFLLGVFELNIGIKREKEK